MGSAETVRRAWLAEFLTRKTLPKDAAKVIALGLTIHRRDMGSATANGNELAHQLLGIERGGYYDDKLAAHVEQSPTKAQHVSLAVVLGGIESATSKSTWRYPEATKSAYLAQLAAWGYSLSEVEQIVIDNAGTSSAPVADEDDSDLDE